MGNVRPTMTIDELVKEAYGNAKAKGFHESPPCDSLDCWEDATHVWTAEHKGRKKTMNLCGKLVCGNAAEAVGYGDPQPVRPRALPEALMLIVTEVAEAMEDHRNAGQYKAAGYSYMDLLYQADGDLTTDPNIYGDNDEVIGMRKPVGLPSELADIVIRCADFAGEHNIDLQHAINEKMRYNATRTHKHGKTC